jgi:hypothetical protein
MASFTFAAYPRQACKGKSVSEVVEYTAPSAAITPPKGPGEQVRTLLIDGESLRAVALQHRIYALTHRRNVVAATSARLVFMRRPLLGGYQPLDVRWQDLKDARLEVGMFSASVTLTYSANLSDTAGGEGETRELKASGLTKSEAEALYRVCQGEEQAWREKRRVRSMEEKRAAAGGVQIATGVYPGGREPGPEALTARSAEQPADRLAQARKMLADGLITDAEFEAIKARIVAAL